MRELSLGWRLAIPWPTQRRVRLDAVRGTDAVSLEARSYEMRYAATDMTTRVLRIETIRQHERIASDVDCTYFPKMLLATVCRQIARWSARTVF